MAISLGMNMSPVHWSNGMAKSMNSLSNLQHRVDGFAW
jgi:hypothetical protein